MVLKNFPCVNKEKKTLVKRYSAQVFLQKISWAFSASVSSVEDEYFYYFIVSHCFLERSMHSRSICNSLEILKIYFIPNYHLFYCKMI